MSKTTERHITVRWTVDGFHRWPDAPEPRDYLADRHRHRFTMSVRIPVLHNERDVEFHDLLDFCAGLFVSPHDFGGRSCETIAEQLAESVADEFRAGEVRATVGEDGYVIATVKVVAE